MKLRRLLVIGSSALSLIACAADGPLPPLPPGPQRDALEVEVRGAAISANASVADVPSALLENARCMLRVLRNTSGVSQAKLGISTSQGWTHPYLEYRADEDASWEQPTRFNVDKPEDPASSRYVFVAVLPGVFDRGSGPDTHVTKNVAQRWKAQCGVDALIITV